MQAPDSGPDIFDQFEQLILALAASFGREADEALITGYWLGLQSLGIERIRHAVSRAIAECEFMPKPVELRRLAGDLSPKVRAVKSWDCFEQAMRSIGAYSSVDFEDPILNATVRNLGGWPYLCQRETEELNRFIRPRFEAVYAALFESGVGVDAAGYLIGLSEQQNSAQGFEVEAPVEVAAIAPVPDEHRRVKQGTATGFLEKIADSMRLPQ